MMDKLPEFTWSDAWLLFSIAIADDGNGANLKSIIKVGDWANHAILTGPELRRGLAKLLHVDYIIQVEDRFSLSGKAKTYWITEKEIRKSILAKMKDFEAFLEVSSRITYDPTFEDPEWHLPAITDEIVNQAYQEYAKRRRARPAK